MNTSVKIVTVFFLCTLLFSVAAQSYQPPEPRMSKNILKKFLMLHMEYPAESIKNNEEGNVKIEFDVDKNGSVENAFIKTGVSEKIDSAALRLFSLILWDPALEYGLPVKSSSEFKIKYNISKYNSFCKKRGYGQIINPFEPVDLSGEIYTILQLDKAPEAVLAENYKSIAEFIAESMNYPEAASKLSLSGVVKLRFVIETNGLPSNIMILDPVGGGCTEEAIRIVEDLKWMPGIKSGEAVRTCYEISIKFDPANELKNKHIPNQSNSGI